jgi:hypothetical protein
MTAFFPLNLTLDGDCSLTQLLPPRREILGLYRERNMPRAARPVGRNISVRFAALARIKDEQNATTAPEYHRQITTSDDFQSYRVTIKSLHSGQILRI